MELLQSEFFIIQDQHSHLMISSVYTKDTSEALVAKITLTYVVLKTFQDGEFLKYLMTQIRR